MDTKINRIICLTALLLFPLTTSIYVCQTDPSFYRKYIYVSNSSNVYSSIQEAINKANNGDIISVPSGIYFENVVINKSVSLIGANPEDTIVDGGGLGSVIYVAAVGSEVSGFTVRNGLYGFYASNCSFVNITLNKIEDNNYGVHYNNTKFNRICKNNITSCNVPIVFQDSQHNYILENFLSHNYGQAVSLYHSNGNVIVRNNIKHNPAFGVYLESSENNTVEWNNISYVCQGIHLESSNNNLITRNTITNTGPYAIILNLSHRNYVYKNLLIKNEIALQLANAHANMISANNVTQNKLGLFVSCSGNNTLMDNVISNSWPFGNFGVYGKMLDDFVNDIDPSNIVNGKPIYYLINQRNIKFYLEDIGYLALVNSSNVILENLNLSGNYQAITLAFSFNVTLRNLQITNNFQGIYLFKTNFSTIIGNSFKGNVYNFYIHDSHFNLIFRNNFFDGKLLDPSRSQNFWDLGYPMGGNYWEGFQIQDDFMGSYQNITGSDGICDFPLRLYAENVDKYPLAAPTQTFFTEYSEDYFVFISNSTISNFNFAPSNGPYILFNAVGPVGTVGFCRVSIPKKLLWVVSDSGWKVFAGNRYLSFTKIEDEYYTYLFFYYSHITEEFRICGTDVVPEFARSFLPLLFAVLFFAVFLIKAKFLFRRFLSGCKNLNFCLEE